MRISLCDRARAAEVSEMNVFSNRGGDFLRIELECIRNYKKDWNCQISNQLRITARQYGEVVLPDEATGSLTHIL